MSTFTISVLANVLAKAIKQGREIKGIQMGKNKNYLIADIPDVQKTIKITHTCIHTVSTNLVKYQDTKSKHKYQLHFYTLTINNLKGKLRKQFHLQQHN